MQALPSLLPAKGFTLLELMLVMVIVAVLAAVVVPGFSGAGYRRQVQAEAERLALAVEVARAEALRRNEIWGLAVSESAYSFKRYDVATGAWEDIERRPFSSHSAEDGVVFSAVATFDNRLAQAAEKTLYPMRGRGYDPWTGDIEEASREKEDVPAVAIYPSGEITPFDVVVSGGDDVLAWVARSDGIRRARATPASAVEERSAALAKLLQAVR